MIKPGKYQHYKGNYYRVLGIARHSETTEKMVVYKALYESEFGKGVVWVRPLSMFLESVSFEGKEVARFTLIVKFK